MPWATTAPVNTSPVSRRTNRRQVDADDAVASSRPLLRRSRETIETRGDLRLSEAGWFESPDELCFQQSACDSTRPQIDVSERVVGKDLSNDDVGDLDAAPWLEDARNLGDSTALIGHEVQDSV